MTGPGDDAGLPGYVIPEFQAQGQLQVKDRRKAHAAKIRMIRMFILPSLDATCDSVHDGCGFQY